MSKTSSGSILLPLSIVFLLLTVSCKPATGAGTPCKPPPCQGKQSWSELVGKDPDTAYLVIRRENSHVTDVVFLVSGVLGHVPGVLGAAGDGEFCCNRVVVVIAALPTSGEGVTKVPKVG